MVRSRRLPGPGRESPARIATKTGLLRLVLAKTEPTPPGVNRAIVLALELNP